MIIVIPSFSSLKKKNLNSAAGLSSKQVPSPHKKRAAGYPTVLSYTTKPWGACFGLPMASGVLRLLFRVLPGRLPGRLRKKEAGKSLEPVKITESHSHPQYNQKD
ncbi:MAG: hypothetical protein MI802_27485 [Desulfobacterales bacterium]|nr:hypothetical protein [Desulfobacterales bacterium]